MTPGSGLYEMSYAAAAVPCTGTEYSGWPRGAISESASFCDIGSQGSMRGWFLKSVNQLQAPNESGSAATTATRRVRRLTMRRTERESGFTTHLDCTVL